MPEGHTHLGSLLLGLMQCRWSPDRLTGGDKNQLMRDFKSRLDLLLASNITVVAGVGPGLQEPSEPNSCRTNLLASNWYNAFLRGHCRSQLSLEFAQLKPTTAFLHPFMLSRLVSVICSLVSRMQIPATMCLWARQT